jgi:hypothetical protein
MQPYAWEELKYLLNCKKKSMNEVQIPLNNVPSNGQLRDENRMNGDGKEDTPNIYQVTQRNGQLNNGATSIHQSSNSDNLNNRTQSSVLTQSSLFHLFADRTSQALWTGRMVSSAQPSTSHDTPRNTRVPTLGSLESLPQRECDLKSEDDLVELILTGHEPIEPTIESPIHESP